MLYLRINFNNENIYTVNINSISLRMNKDLYDSAYGLYFPHLGHRDEIKILKESYDFILGLITGDTIVDEDAKFVDVYLKEVNQIW